MSVCLSVSLDLFNAAPGTSMVYVWAVGCLVLNSTVQWGPGVAATSLKAMEEKNLTDLKN